MASKRTQASAIALGGVMAALAVVIMNLGGLIPVATYVCPVLCMMILQVVLKLCGKRIAWAWYGAVAILALLMSPDKEAAAVFVCLGYYPIVKPALDKTKGKWIRKLLLFNGSTLVMYWLLMYLIGMDWLVAEFEEMGIALTVVTLLLGNVTFFLLDNLLGRKLRKRK